MTAIISAFPTPDQTGVDADLLLDDFLDAARAWDAGRLALPDLLRVMTPRERYSARRRLSCDRTDPDHVLFCRIMDAIVEQQFTRGDGQVVVTRQGVFTQRELEGNRFYHARHGG